MINIAYAKVTMDAGTTVYVEWDNKNYSIIHYWDSYSFKTDWDLSINGIIYNSDSIDKEFKKYGNIKTNKIKKEQKDNIKEGVYKWGLVFDNLYINSVPVEYAVLKIYDLNGFNENEITVMPTPNVTYYSDEEGDYALDYNNPVNYVLKFPKGIEVRLLENETGCNIEKLTTLTYKITGNLETCLDPITFTSSNVTIVGVNDSGTSTGVSSTTLSDSTKSWTTNSLVGRLLVIENGTGANQTRKILSNSGTSLTVNAWTTQPPAGSNYTICLRWKDIYDTDLADDGVANYSEYSMRSFKFNGIKMYIGDGTTPTCIGSLQETLEFNFTHITVDWQYVGRVYNGTRLYLGEITSPAKVTGNYGSIVINLANRRNNGWEQDSGVKSYVVNSLAFLDLPTGYFSFAYPLPLFISRSVGFNTNTPLSINNAETQTKIDYNVNYAINPYYTCGNAGCYGTDTDYGNFSYYPNWILFNEGNFISNYASLPSAGTHIDILSPNNVYDIWKMRRLTAFAGVYNVLYNITLTVSDEQGNNLSNVLCEIYNDYNQTYYNLTYINTTINSTYSQYLVTMFYNDTGSSPIYPKNMTYNISCTKSGYYDYNEIYKPTQYNKNINAVLTMKKCLSNTRKIEFSTLLNNICWST